MAKDELELESVADDYRKEPLSNVQDIDPNAGRKKDNSLLNKVHGRVSELKSRYSSYQNMQREKQKEKAIKTIARAKEDRELRLLEKQAAHENVLNSQLKAQTQAMNKRSGAGNPLGGALSSLRSFQKGRAAYREKLSHGGSSGGLLSGGSGGGSKLLSGGMGSGSKLLKGGLGGGKGLLMGGLGGKSKLLSGGLGKSGMSLSLGKGKGLKL